MHPASAREAAATFCAIWISAARFSASVFTLPTTTIIHLTLQRQSALDDRRPVDAARQVAKREAALAEASDAERVGQRGRRVTKEQAGLQCERHVLDDAARAPLRGGGVC